MCGVLNEREKYKRVTSRLPKGGSSGEESSDASGTERGPEEQEARGVKARDGREDGARIPVEGFAFDAFRRRTKESCLDAGPRAPGPPCERDVLTRTETSQAASFRACSGTVMGPAGPRL